MPSRANRRGLIELERKAYDLRNAGRVKEAAELFQVIVLERPDWEHGAALYSLANCHEDMGELKLAEQRYRDALSYQPKNPIFIGGYASFLYLHGDARKAFQSFLELLAVEHRNGNQKGIDNTIVALQSLGKKMGLSEQDVSEEVATALSQTPK